jgi:predicted ATP-grasp superfamily ATP-dependent carboligase
MRVLVIGINVRHIACSAARAGHQVFAADGYCDLDLQRCASKTAMFSQENPERIEETVDSFVKLFPADAVVLGPGLEEASVENARVLNNTPELAAHVSDKLWLARWLEKEGFPFIPTRSSPENLSFPAMAKPRKGAGGVGCRIVQSEADLPPEKGQIFQELMEGRPASVSVVSTGSETRALAANEQLIGTAWSGAEGFRYSGNITPLEPPASGLTGMAEEIVSRLGLVGSNGVDFLLTEKGPVVVEVNPRFQGSLDTVELSTGVNVFQAHMDAIEGCLPARPRPQLVAGRSILFASRDLQINEDLSGPSVADVPKPGSRIKMGDPVLSLLATGKDRSEVLAQLMKSTAELGARFKRKLNCEE